MKKKTTELQSSKEQLKKIKAELSPGDTEEALESPGVSPAPIPAPGQDFEAKAQATGLVAKLACGITDIVLAKTGKGQLSAQERENLTGPLDEIEIRYLPMVVSKYAEQASPFLELALAGYAIFEARKKEQPKPETKPQGPADQKETAAEQKPAPEIHVNLN